MKTTFSLHPVAPFQLEYTVLALRRRSKNNVDLWDGHRYTRLLVIENVLVKVVVEQKEINKPELLLSIDSQNEVSQNQIASQIEKMLGIKWDLNDFYHLTQHDAQLNPLVVQFKGVKPPRFPSLFEALVNAVSCQQISLDAGLHIQNRLAEFLSMRIKEKERILYAFPRPEEVAHCTVSDLKKIGYSTHKSETLRQLAVAIMEEESSFGSLENKANGEVIDFLCRFKGIGRWTAEYVLLRGLGRIETFPGDDIGAQNNLYQLLHLDKKPDYKKTAEITAKWHPYAGLVYFHLLLQRLYDKRILK
ncbi:MULTISPECIES: DNA-3-methyladenine glycosylase family protein [Legionella]|uniref:DNA-3-methyladenine glycosylase II n=1 Tax=Legionella resiliens TaxID=2905958 RepID=A0ABS8X395_9GAMM|nr:MULTISPECIES: DNA-3-methyladenine glycosylase 2 family protein [unclassified Legionella]MCE0722914.1 DNA-3-methyladenine glycosylase 2 family protein [Legionella sp. 9fVS26]MCE3532067.1 DNA-3-methyladenine glycosylase 2 family protein [Legionella sp. 8cVS16]QLZ68193.1 DNA-3-methyladenine glycosylase 2 family protein [Legionella sp. PC1000]